jgi:hypothetical protein
MGERLLEGPHDVLARRQVPAPGRDLRPQEISHRRDPFRDRCKRGRPSRLDDLIQVPCCHGE